MEEILNHLGCINSVNNGIFTISAGAGFLPSTVVGYIGNISYSLLVATRRRKRQRLDLISSLTWKLKQRNHERTKNPSSRFHLVFFSTVFTPQKTDLGGGFICFFTPYLGKMNPFWRAYFSHGLVKNHHVTWWRYGIWQKWLEISPWHTLGWKFNGIQQPPTFRGIFGLPTLRLAEKRQKELVLFCIDNVSCFNPYISSSYPYMCMTRPSFKRACKNMD